MKKMIQLRQKKGFTMIELIVVIAIIGILTAMILPAMSSSDRPTAGKSYAKDYYYRVQSFMSRKKIAGNKAITGDTVFFLDMKADNKNVIASDWETSCGIIKEGAKVYCASIDGDMKELALQFARNVGQSMTSVNYDGTFYAVVDSGYRVTKSYWTETDNWSNVSGKQFTDNCMLESGFCTCAYPLKLCTPAGDVLKMPE